MSVEAADREPGFLSAKPLYGSSPASLPANDDAARAERGRLPGMEAPDAGPRFGHDFSMAGIQASERGGTDGQAAPNVLHAIARTGISGGSRRLPFLSTIQSAFGSHDVTGVRAHTGAAAVAASEALAANAYAAGDDIVFGAPPDLHTAAHEAAHVVQQRAGVSLKDGMGTPGDRYERHADSVADIVARGGSAQGLLDEVIHGGPAIRGGRDVRDASLGSALSPGRDSRIAGRSPQRASASQRPTLQLQPRTAPTVRKKDGKKATPKKDVKKAIADVPALIAELKVARSQVRGNVTRAQDYLAVAIPAADQTAVVMNEAASNYGTAFDQHVRIVDKANEAAASKQSILDTMLGFGIGVAVGVLAEVALPAAATVGAITLTGAGTELAEVLVGLGVGAMDITKQSTRKPLDLNPSAVSAKHYLKLMAIYRGLAITGQSATAAGLVLEAITYLEGQARLLQAKARADIDAGDLAKHMATIRKAETYIMYPARSAAELQEALDARKNPPGAWQMERYIWVYWISQLGGYDEESGRYQFGDTDILDNDTIEGYLHGSINVLGANSLLDVDFGGYTSEDDEEDAVRAANDAYSAWVHDMRKYLE